MRLGQAGEFGQTGRLGETHDGEIALMHFQQHARARRDRVPIVGQPGAVGRPYLHQPGAALPDDVGDAKAAADLHQLATRDDHLAVAGQGGQRQQQGGRVVVDAQPGLRAGHLTQQRLQPRRARAASAGLEIELQVDGAASRLGRSPDRFRGHRRAAEIGVHDDAGRVQHAPQPRDMRGLERRLRARHQRIDVVTRRVAGQDGASRCRQLGPQRVGDD